MKMKIQVLYLTGTALLIGAAGGGADGRRRHRLLGLWPGLGN